MEWEVLHTCSTNITITAQALFYQQVALERLKNSQPARSHQQSQSMIVSPSGRDC